MFANTTALKLKDNDELITELSNHVNELHYCDFDDDSRGDVSYILCHIRVIADILQDRVNEAQTDDIE